MYHLCNKYWDLRCLGAATSNIRLLDIIKQPFFIALASGSQPQSGFHRSTCISLLCAKHILSLSQCSWDYKEEIPNEKRKLMQKIKCPLCWCKRRYWSLSPFLQRYERKICKSCDAFEDAHAISGGEISCRAIFRVYHVVCVVLLKLPFSLHRFSRVKTVPRLKTQVSVPRW